VRGWIGENVRYGEGLAENVRIPPYGGRVSKIAQKNYHIIKRSLIIAIITTKCIETRKKFLTSCA